MGTITVKYKSKKQLSILKKVLSALEFEVIEKTENPSPGGDKWFENPKNLEMIKAGETQLRSGRGKSFTSELKKNFSGYDFPCVNLAIAEEHILTFKKSGQKFFCQKF